VAMKGLEEDLGEWMRIKLAQDMFHWHVCMNGDGHSYSTAAWDVYVSLTIVKSPIKILDRGFHSMFVLYYILCLIVCRDI
jgi:hypothetical protein